MVWSMLFMGTVGVSVSAALGEGVENFAEGACEGEGMGVLWQYTRGMRGRFWLLGPSVGRSAGWFGLVDVFYKEFPRWMYISFRESGLVSWGLVGECWCLEIYYDLLIR